MGKRMMSSDMGMRKMGGGGRKRCPLTSSGITSIDYKDIELLCKFVTERGKILPRRITGVSCHHQRLLTIAIKRARHMAMLPFVSNE